MNKQRGFTLIEIAIVLVIIGLLLGGVLKGQELITGARVRNLISQQDGVKAAYFGFVDRFRALPGDYALATTNINGTTVKGNGNGQIESAGAVVNGSIAAEDIGAWEHLSRAGFITGSYTPGGTPAYATTSAPANPYGAFLVLRYDAGYVDTGTAAVRHNLKTGNQIPADLLAEIDRKVDDGAPDTGTFRFSAIAISGTVTQANCMTAGTAPAAGTWKLIGTIEPNCGGATVF